MIPYVVGKQTICVRGVRVGSRLTLLVFVSANVRDIAHDVRPILKRNVRRGV